MNAVSLPVWVWLFPATFALHILEEGLAGETFGRWIGYVVGRQLGQRPFFAANGVLLLAMMLFIRITQGLADQAWLAAMLGALVTANGLGHLTGTIIVRIYSPGLYTGVFLWVPLGGLSLYWSSSRMHPGPWVLAMAAGLGLMVGVGLIGYSLSKPINQRR